MAARRLWPFLEQLDRYRHGFEELPRRSPRSPILLGTLLAPQGFSNGPSSSPIRGRRPVSEALWREQRAEQNRIRERLGNPLEAVTVAVELFEEGPKRLAAIAHQLDRYRSGFEDVANPILLGTLLAPQGFTTGVVLADSRTAPSRSGSRLQRSAGCSCRAATSSACARFSGCSIACWNLEASPRARAGARPFNEAMTWLDIRPRAPEISSTGRDFSRGRSCRRKAPAPINRNAVDAGGDAGHCPSASSAVRQA